MRLADALGLAGAGLGAPMLAAPAVTLRTAGIRPDPTARVIIAAVGAREFAATATILALGHRRIGVWSRVLGDTVDLALLGTVFRARRENTPRWVRAGAVIGAIFLTDLGCAVALDRADGVWVRDGSDRTGEGAPDSTPDGPPQVRTAVTILKPEAEVREAFLTSHFDGFNAAALEASGAVQFFTAPGERGTEVHVVWAPGLWGPAVLAPARRLTGRAPDQKVHDQLRRLKARMETGVEVRSEKTPESFNALRQIFQRPARPLGAQRSRDLRSDG